MTAIATPGPVRADARRNRQIVLRAAAEVFAEDGLEVSLGRIARQAGVGAGTVYRHFPSKEILLEAVLAEQVEGFVAVADRWAARARPGDGRTCPNRRQASSAWTDMAPADCPAIVTLRRSPPEVLRHPQALSPDARRGRAYCRAGRAPGRSASRHSAASRIPH